MKYQGTGFIDYAGYHQCIVLENKTTRVILGPHCGGRILEYSWKGNNVIYLDPKQDGWVYISGKPEIDPMAWLPIDYVNWNLLGRERD